jgi:hypothetical protein
MWLRGRLLFLSFACCFLFAALPKKQDALTNDGAITDGRDDRLHVIDPGLQVLPTRTKDVCALWHRLQLHHGLQQRLRLNGILQ